MSATPGPELTAEIVNAVMHYFTEPYSAAFERLLHRHDFTYEALSVAKSEAGTEVLHRRDRLAQDPARAARSSCCALLGPAHHGADRLNEVAVLLQKGVDVVEIPERGGLRGAGISHRCSLFCPQANRRRRNGDQNLDQTANGRWFKVPATCPLAGPRARGRLGAVPKPSTPAAVYVGDTPLHVQQIADAARRPYRQLFRRLHRTGRISDAEIEGLRLQLRLPLIVEDQPDPRDVL